MREAMTDRNDWNVLLTMAHGRPVSAAAVVPIGGRPTVSRLLASGYIERHAVVYLVITEAGRSHLAGAGAELLCACSAFHKPHPHHGPALIRRGGSLVTRR